MPNVRPGRLRTVPECISLQLGFRDRVGRFEVIYIYIYTANSQRLGHPYLHTPKGTLKGIPALIILKPCSNFLEFTV